MTHPNSMHSAANDESTQNKRAMKSVVATVIAIFVITFALALNGIGRNDSSAQPLVNTVSSEYFPDGYVNKATEVEPLPPTF